MFEKIKKMFDNKTEKTNVSKLSETEKEYMEKLEEKEKLEQELKEWEEYKSEVKALLPFEKIERLEVQLELLKVKEKISIIKAEEKREQKGSSPELDRIVVNIRKKIEDTKEKLKKIYILGRRLHLSYNGQSLNKDPRNEIKQELDSQKKYKKIINFIDEHKKILKRLNRNKKNIINQVRQINKGEVQQHLITVSREDKRKIGRIRKIYKKKINKGLGNKLQLVEKELERVRQDMIDQEELKV
jgi:hypothetical protein